MWKNMFFSSGNCKKGLQVCIGKWKRPSEQVAWGEANLAIKNSSGDITRCEGSAHESKSFVS
jgi:hypothetical protein